MLAIKGVYEIVIRVKDLQRAETFYTKVLGMEVGLRQDARNMLFLRAGGQARILSSTQRNERLSNSHHLSKQKSFIAIGRHLRPLGPPDWSAVRTDI